MIKPPLPKALLALLFAGGLAACDITPARTLWALRKVDPMTTAPEDIRLALRIPQGFRPDINGIALVGTLKATSTEPDDSERFTIEREVDPQLPSWMRRAGAPLFGYKIADRDLGRFRAFQRKAAQAKADKRSGEISVATEVCRLDRELPEKVLVSVFLKTGEIDEFVALFEDQDILEHTTREDVIERVPLCQ